MPRQSVQKAITNSFVLAIALLCVGAPAHSAPSSAIEATDLPNDERFAPLQLSNPTTYQLEMTTRLVIPSDGDKITGISLWHALPTKRAWSGQDAASDISFAPNDAKQEHERKFDSQNVVWREKKDFAPGSELSFTTHYTVHSVARRFDPSDTKLEWAKDFTPPTDINAELATVADDIRQKFNPAEAILQFCTDVKNSITYDASVKYLPSDVDATMLNRRGHCGHIYNVFKQLCRRVGIPVRVVRGLHLSTPNGYGHLAGLRADWTNVHTWAEVYFPEVGWVEVEPAAGAKAFSISANYIQNNTWYQNYVLHIYKGAKFQGAGWVPENGVFVSPYKVENLITFTSSPD